MKKAQGLSMNVIIIAALALIVLVILAVVFMGKMGPWVTETDSCVNNGGRCVDLKSECTGPYEEIRTGRNYGCPEDKYCCIGVQIAE